MRRGSTLLAMVTLLVLGTVGLAGAGSAVFVTLDRSPSHGPPGTVISYEGECWWGSEENQFQGDQLTIELKDPGGNTVEQQSPTMSGDSGNFSGTIQVPADAELGEWTLVATCYSTELDTQETAQRPFQVEEEDAKPADITRAEPTFTG